MPIDLLDTNRVDQVRSRAVGHQGTGVMLTETDDAP
jgi:hypothetical protein